MIICFDFDDTMDIKKEPYPAIGEENHLMLNTIKSHIKNGDTVILNTMREGEILKKAVDWLKARGIVPDAINDNCEALKREYKNNPRKIACDINYDNKNFLWGSRINQDWLYIKSEHQDKETMCYNCYFWENPDDNGEEYNYCNEREEDTYCDYWCKDWEERI